MSFSQRVQRRGTYTVFSAMGATGLFGLCALVVDIGFIKTNMLAQDNVVEAAARAGAVELQSGTNSARDAAIAVGASNGMALTTNDVEIGTYSAQGGFILDEADGDAVRVTAPPKRISFLFAPLLGMTGMNLSADATVQLSGGGGGGGGGECSGSIPNCALMGIDEMTVNGNAFTDSWNSNEGSYVAGLAYSNGGICSNGSITVQGSSDINGDASVPPGENVSVTGAAQVYGDVVELDGDFDVAEVDIDPIKDNNDNDSIQSSSWVQGDKLKKSGNGSWTIPPGTYYFEKITLNGNAHLSTSGYTEIWTDGETKLNGTGNTGNSAADLRIIHVGEGKVTINGNHDFYGTIYAPDAEVEFNGTAKVFGSIIAGDIEFNGTGDFHYDEALDNSDLIAGCESSDSAFSVARVD